MVAILNDTVGQPFILTVLAVLAVVLFLVLLVLLIALATGFIADRRGRRRKIRMGSK
jgi:MFS family permease